MASLWATLAQLDWHLRALQPEECRVWCLSGPTWVCCVYWTICGRARWPCRCLSWMLAPWSRWLACYEGAARASYPHDLSSRGPGVDTKHPSRDQGRANGAAGAIVVMRGWCWCRVPGILGGFVMWSGVWKWWMWWYFGMGCVRDSLSRIKVVVVTRANAQERSPHKSALT